ncbi:MAG: hypothetical protein KY462_04385 [Actinobacteria bacterium]|nr:hypothetical protein [Actinomycetota bacterium]
MQRDRAESDVSSRGSGATVPAASHLEELYAACCLYAGGDRAGESLLVSVLPSLVACPAGTDPSTLHRLTYQAAADLGRMPPEEPTRGSDLHRAMAGLPLPARAAVYLVDAVGMRYVEVAAVLGIDARDVSGLVASGRRQLRSFLSTGAPDSLR